MSSNVPCEVQVGIRVMSATLGENTRVEASPFACKPVRVPSCADNAFNLSSTGILWSLAMACGTKSNRVGKLTKNNPHTKDRTALQSNSRRGTNFQNSVTAIVNATKVE